MYLQCNARTTRGSHIFFMRIMGLREGLSRKPQQNKGLNRWTLCKRVLECPPLVPFVCFQSSPIHFPCTFLFIILFMQSICVFIILNIFSCVWYQSSLVADMCSSPLSNHTHHSPPVPPVQQNSIFSRSNSNWFVDSCAIPPSLCCFPRRPPFSADMIQHNIIIGRATAEFSNSKPLHGFVIIFWNKTKKISKRRN